MEGLESWLQRARLVDQSGWEASVNIANSVLALEAGLFNFLYGRIIFCLHT